MPDRITEIESLLRRLPDLEKGKMPAVDPGLAEKLLERLLKGGEGLVRDLASRIDEVDSGKDWKARFLLHRLTMLVGAPDRAAQRGMLAGLLLEESIGGRPAGVRVFLLSQLRLVADGTAVPKVVVLLGANESEIVDAAALVLVSIGVDALPPLRKALAGAQGPQRDAIGNAIAQMGGL
jgi:hypothetical protein